MAKAWREGKKNGDEVSFLSKTVTPKPESPLTLGRKGKFQMGDRLISNPSYS